MLESRLLLLEGGSLFSWPELALQEGPELFKDLDIGWLGNSSAETAMDAPSTRRPSHREVTRVTALLLTGSELRLIPLGEADCARYINGVLTANHGASGSALATALSNVLSVCIMLTHFLKKKNSLRLAKPERLFHAIGRVFAIGFSVFFVDLAMGIMTMLYNKQILKLLNNDALSVFGAIASLTTVVQCCSYSIGQAAQPILSANFGAKLMDRVRQVLRYGIFTSVAFGAFWVVVTMGFPKLVINIFMDATDSVLAIDPGIMRKYCIGYLFVPFTLFATYYFQSILKARVSMGISLSRGLVVGAVMLYLMPPVFGADSLWFATPVAEVTVALVTILLMSKFTRELN